MCAADLNRRSNRFAWKSTGPKLKSIVGSLTTPFLDRISRHRQQCAEGPKTKYKLRATVGTAYDEKFAAQTSAHVQHIFCAALRG